MGPLQLQVLCTRKTCVFNKRRVITVRRRWASMLNFRIDWNTQYIKDQLSERLNYAHTYNIMVYFFHSKSFPIKHQQLKDRAIGTLTFASPCHPARTAHSPLRCASVYTLFFFDCNCHRLFVLSYIWEGCCDAIGASCISTDTYMGINLLREHKAL